MDVRCEKCGTEYEFDEGKLKPAGVTVKCAECGHMFRVRRRSLTNQALPPVRRGASHPPPVPTAPRTTPTTSPLKTTTGVSQRVWLVRDEDGLVQTCRELQTLQQWVVAGRVTKSCEISRTGKSWKTLGSIAELGSFFRIAEEARRRAGTSEPPGLSPEGGVPTPYAVESTEPLPGVVRPPASTEADTQPSVRGRPAAPAAPVEPVPEVATEPSPMPAGAVVAAPAPAPAAPAPAAPAPAPVPAPAAPAPASAAPAPAPAAKAATEPAVLGAKGGSPKLIDPEGRNTGGWAVAPSLKLDSEAAGPSGPTGGLAKGVPTTEAAFAAGGKGKLAGAKGPTVDDIMPASFDPTDAYLDNDDDLVVPRGGAAKWIVFVSLLVIGGAAGAVYFFVFRDGGGKQGQVAITAPADAGAAAQVPDTPDQPPPDQPPTADLDPAIDATYADLAADTPLALDTAGKRLAASSSTDAKQRARLAAARARVMTAQAQHLLDGAKGDSAAQIKQLAGEAAQLAADGLAAAADSVDAKVAMADALRLKGAPTRDVERRLKEVLQGDPRHREALLVRAMLRERDGKVAEARRMYQELAKDGADVRPHLRLAVLDLGEKKLDEAKAGAQKVLGMQAEHASATRLLERIAEATAVVATDPMPPEIKDDDGGGRSSGGSRGEDYDSVLERADKAAETGRCSAAMELYERALDLNSAGVGALVGMGYCHIDAKQFASAHAKFRAALGISSGHHGALIGIAEAYAYQGLNKQAVEAYRRYLEVHPNGPKAAMARKQIERLGGSSGAGGGDGAGDDGADDGDDTKPPSGQPFDDEPPPPAEPAKGDSAKPTAPAPAAPVVPAKEDDEDLGDRADPGEE